MEAAQISTVVHDKYSSIARSTSKNPGAAAAEANCCDPKCCSNGEKNCSPKDASATANDTSTAGDYATRVASSFGYSADALSSLPPNTNLGLSCGNPLALTHIHPTETVIDLGSGGALDVLLAAKTMLAHPSLKNPSGNTLPTGGVIGIDSSADMISLARRNVAAANLPPPFVDNISFVNAPITSIPLPASSANLILSNCVINLVPAAHKSQVFQEIYRLLKPGGRVAISDILTKDEKPLPDEIRTNVALMVGCVAGAASVADYRRWMVEAGFEDGERENGNAEEMKGKEKKKIIFRATGADLNAYKLTSQEREAGAANGNATGCCGGECCGASVREERKLLDEDLLRDVDFNEWVASYEIYAVK